MDMVLIGGLWLAADVWEPVEQELRERGHRGVAVSLPGQGDENASATLAEQVDAVTLAIGGADRPLVVGHSAAATLAWMGADRAVGDVSGVVFIGGFPAAEGEAYADFFEPVDGWMTFPGWSSFEGPDSVDLSAEQKEALSATMVGVPAGVSRGTVTFTNPARHDVPAAVLCPEFSPAEAQAAIQDGQAPELALAKHCDLVDIDSGHWPMVSCPGRLAGALSEIAAKLA